ncbi:spermine oxidase-like [Agrilus planipennis]|uniref:Spermine oxidase-like n=1 Tax=Agrilus planipennis TaxID=224129 RepID=A0A7F5RAZ5_AGRPL|nr:spermine oxidase-like [Agrilus planipennis]
MSHQSFTNGRDMKAFIRFATACALFLVHYCKATDQHSVIIVGAGSSGIAAATKLLENNFTDFIILEAENRIGGRIFTVPFGNGLVDLGAQWCHGQKDNIVYEIVKDLDVLKVDDVNSITHLYTKFSVDKNTSDTVNRLFESIYENMEEDPNAASLHDYFVKRYNNSINELYSDKPEILQYAKDATNLYLGAICSLESSFDVSDISTQSEYQICEGDQSLQWNGKGYKIFLDILMKKYPNPNESLPIDDKILLNKEVTNINWQNSFQPNSSKSEVKCSNGEVYYANHVIVTVSLGVLKENGSTMFTPKLPNEKIKAIDDIGFGAVMKIYLLYEEKWWPENLGSLSFVWSEEERERLKHVRITI